MLGSMHPLLFFPALLVTAVPTPLVPQRRLFGNPEEQAAKAYPLTDMIFEDTRGSGKHMKPLDYFPLHQGLWLEFDGEAPPEKTHSKFEILTVTYPNLLVGDRTDELDTLCLVANCRWNMGKEFKIVKRPDGVFRERELIFPLPMMAGASWIGEEGALHGRIT